MSSTPAKSQGRAPDPRPARTRAAVLDAIERLGAAGVEPTVAGVVAEAGLSRSSFYSQFKDLGDVAVQLVEQTVETLIAADVSARADKQQSDDEVTMASIELFLAEFNERRHLYAAILGSGANIASQRKVCEIMTRTSLPAFLRQPSARVNPEFAARFLAAGTLANVIEWVTSDDPVSLDEMKQQIFSVLPVWVTPQA